MTINPDLGLEADSILGFVGMGLLAYGLGARQLGIAGTGALLAGWFGGLALARIGGFTAAVQSIEAGEVNATANTNGGGSGTP